MLMLLFLKRLRRGTYKPIGPEELVGQFSESGFAGDLLREGSWTGDRALPTRLEVVLGKLGRAPQTGRRWPSLRLMGRLSSRLGP